MVVASILQIARFNNINNSLYDTGYLVHIQSPFGSTSGETAILAPTGEPTVPSPPSTTMEFLEQIQH